MVLTVSTRGNAESIVCALVLLHVYLMAKVLYSNNHHEKDKNGHWQRDLDMAAVVLGLATHVKLFPVLFGMGFAIRCLRASKYVILVRFMVISAGTFFALTFATWSLFGWQGLNASLLYHLTRQDPRHNFAPHFYPIYLIQSSTVDRTRHIACSSTIATLLKQNWPSLIQFAAVLGVSVLDGVSYPVSCFLQTATFVTFNRVITSQYFLWYLCLVPCIPSELLSSISLIIPWTLVQSTWLAQAYQFEFGGKDKVTMVWACSLLMQLTNSWLIARVINSLKSRLVDTKVSEHGVHPMNGIQNRARLLTPIKNIKSVIEDKTPSPGRTIIVRSMLGSPQRRQSLGDGRIAIEPSIDTDASRAQSVDDIYANPNATTENPFARKRRIRSKELVTLID